MTLQRGDASRGEPFTLVANANVGLEAADAEVRLVDRWTDWGSMLEKCEGCLAKDSGSALSVLEAAFDQNVRDFD
jgi:hypothetical protein